MQISKNITVGKKSSGVSLIELMITLSILIVIATVAAPNFSLFIQNSRLTQEADGLFVLLNKAKQLAISRGGRVYICINTNAVTPACDGQANHTWEGVKIVYTMPVNTPVTPINNRFLDQRIQVIGASLNSQETIRAIVAEVPAGNPSVTLRPNVDDTVIAFSGLGRLLNQTPFWVAVCDGRDNPEQAGKLVGVLDTGQIRMIDLLDANDDQVAVDCEGNP